MRLLFIMFAFCLACGKSPTTPSKPAKAETDQRLTLVTRQLNTGWDTDVWFGETETAVTETSARAVLERVVAPAHQWHEDRECPSFSFCQESNPWDVNLFVQHRFAGKVDFDPITHYPHCRIHGIRSLSGQHSCENDKAWTVEFTWNDEQLIVQLKHTTDREKTIFKMHKKAPLELAAKYFATKEVNSSSETHYLRPFFNSRAKKVSAFFEKVALDLRRRNIDPEHIPLDFAIDLRSRLTPGYGFGLPDPHEELAKLPHHVSHHHVARPSEAKELAKNVWVHATNSSNDQKLTPRNESTEVNAIALSFALRDAKGMLLDYAEYATAKRSELFPLLRDELFKYAPGSRIRFWLPPNAFSTIDATNGPLCLDVQIKRFANIPDFPGATAPENAKHFDDDIRSKTLRAGNGNKPELSKVFVRVHYWNSAGELIDTEAWQRRRPRDYGAECSTPIKRWDERHCLERKAISAMRTGDTSLFWISSDLAERLDPQQPARKQRKVMMVELSP